MSSESAESFPEPAGELRMLRAKAYGPSGGLSEQELARLRELEGWDDASTGSAIGVVEGPPDASTGSAIGVVEGPPDASTSSAIGAADAPPQPRRWPLVALSAVALLAVGLGVGWGMWGWDAEASALAAAHADTQAELEAEQTFDPGTVVALAADHGVVVWSASRSDGDELCVIVSTPSRDPQTDCVTVERVADYAWPSAMVTVPDGEDKAGQQLSASLIPQSNGDFVPFLQVWGEDSTWELQYSEDELTQLRAVEAIGYRGEMLQILGTDGDRIVWSSWETGTLCVVAPTSAHGFAETCAEGPDDTVVLSTEVDGISTRYVVTQHEMRSPQLTIYKDVDAEYYFGADEPQFDDFFSDSSSIDDRTGE